MIGRKKLFQHLGDLVVHKVRLGDNKELEVLGKGSVAVQVQGDQRKLIHGVKYVSNLAHNLLSVQQLIENVYQVVFYEKSCLIQDAKSGDVLVKVCKNNNNLFPIEFVEGLQSNSVNKVVMSSDEESLLWYKRFGHLNCQSLNLFN